MLCFVTAGKHVNNIRVIAGQPSITTMEKLSENFFSIGSARRLYNGIPAERVPIFSSERMLHEDYYRKGSVEKRISEVLTPRRNDWR
jgi:hypothetical protein